MYRFTLFNRWNVYYYSVCWKMYIRYHNVIANDYPKGIIILRIFDVFFGFCRKLRWKWWSYAKMKRNDRNIEKQHGRQNVSKSKDVDIFCDLNKPRLDHSFGFEKWVWNRTGIITKPQWTRAIQIYSTNSNFEEIRLIDWRLYLRSNAMPRFRFSVFTTF